MSVSPFNPYGGQTGYTINTAPAFAGMLADISPLAVRSYTALEAVGFGLALVMANASTPQCRLPMINQVVLTESANLVASNVVNGNVNVTTIVNGARTTTTTAIAAQTYATSDAVTLAAIAAAIAAVPGVKSAVAASPNITVLANNDTEITLSGFVTTAGASQNTWSTVNTCNDYIVGVSMFEQTIQNDLNLGTAVYPLGAAVNVLTAGRIYVTPEVTINGPTDSVYARFQVSGSQVRGAFRNTAGGSPATALQLTRARWLDSIANGATGVLEISLP